MRRLRTVVDVIDTLGGLDAVCELTEANEKAVCHWISRTKIFPANTYVVMQRKLRKRKASAPDWLWNMRGIERRAA